MAEPASSAVPGEATRRSCTGSSIDTTVRIVSLRHLDPESEFAAGLVHVGLSLQPPLRCAITAAAAGRSGVLAWRSPTETVWICEDVTHFESARRDLPAAGDGCLVDQTHGRRLIRLSTAGARLLAHLGRGFAELEVGHARCGRMADLAVLACRPSADELLLVVDRLYLEHFVGHLNSVNFGELVP